MDESHTIRSQSNVVFRKDYAIDQAELHKLYENAKRDQWNATKDIPWSTPVDAERGVIADELVDAFATDYWRKLSTKQQGELNRRIAAWRLSTLMYGEHGAMLVCSQLVEMVAGGDAKFFQATQVVDEARHTEVLNRYITEKLDGLRYPMPHAEQELFDMLIGDSRWPVKTIGLQLVAETFAVSLFRMLGETSKDGLLREICRRILADESRHMGFGMLSLPGVVAGSSEAERRELEEVTEWALVKTLKGMFPYEPYRDMGFSEAEIEDIRRLKRERQAGGEAVLFRQVFKKELDSSLLQNLARIGLLNERSGERLNALGIRASGTPAS
ncbi:MAG TPA: ferritin-like domain-containing protein [Candidatus Binatia bacterium]|nr:ferritin-like domain-containing protein [Candidatus Binatia bacterium]